MSTLNYIIVRNRKLIGMKTCFTLLSIVKKYLYMFKYICTEFESHRSRVFGNGSRIKEQYDFNVFIIMKA